MFRIFKAYPFTIQCIFAIYIFSFSGATLRHIGDIIQRGWLPYTNTPLWMNAYWTSLTFLDPLAVLLIFISPLWAVCLAIFIMVSDVIINFYASYQIINLPFAQNIFLQAQTGFAIFVLLTAPYIWYRLNHRSKVT